MRLNELKLFKEKTKAKKEKIYRKEKILKYNLEYWTLKLQVE